MKLTVASFNIGSSHKMHMHYSEENLHALAKVIAGCGADVICLQEVDKGARRSQGVDMAAFFSEQSEYPYVHFIRIRAFQGGEYGTAILSRYPITESGTFNYPVKICTQGTSAGYAVIEAEGQPLTVFNTHLSCENEEANTEALNCYRNLLLAYRKGTDRELIAMGDFNTNPDRVETYIPEFPGVNPWLHTYEEQSIDNILLSPGVRAENVRILDTTTNRESDHNMLLCEIEY